MVIMKTQKSDKTSRNWVIYPPAPKDTTPESFDSEAEFERRYGGQEWITGRKRGKVLHGILKSYFRDLKHATILDLGSGYGGISLVFSKNSRQTLGLDITKDLLLIAKKRAEIAHQENFNALLAGGHSLPLQRACIDVILMIGVLEYIPRSKPFTDPKLTHLEVLKDIRRVLRAKGVLLIGIENRYWLGYWFGRRDHHTGMHFITIIPRRLANMVYKLRVGIPYYLERTPSCWELDRMLSHIGLKVAKRFTVLPGWGHTEMVADLDDEGDIKRKIDLIKLWKPLIFGLPSLDFIPKIMWKVLISLGLAKFFCSNFVYVCIPKDTEVSVHLRDHESHSLSQPPFSPRPRTQTR